MSDELRGGALSAAAQITIFDGTEDQKARIKKVAIVANELLLAFLRREEGRKSAVEKRSAAKSE